MAAAVCSTSVSPDPQEPDTFCTRANHRSSSWIVCFWLATISEGGALATSRACSDISIICFSSVKDLARMKELTRLIRCAGPEPGRPDPRRTDMGAAASGAPRSPQAVSAASTGAPISPQPISAPKTPSICRPSGKGAATDTRVCLSDRFSVTSLSTAIKAVNGVNSLWAIPSPIISGRKAPI